jgi:hypothetical protein
MEEMMRGDIIDQYPRLNLEDQKAFSRWLWANTIVGAILLTGLIVLVSKFSSDQSVATAQNSSTIATKSASTKATLKRETRGIE